MHKAYQMRSEMNLRDEPVKFGGAALILKEDHLIIERKEHVLSNVASSSQENGTIPCQKWTEGSKPNYGIGSDSK